MCTGCKALGFMTQNVFVLARNALNLVMDMRGRILSLRTRLLPALLLCCFVTATTSSAKAWGFWAHQRINRMAVFTLPTEMLMFYKKNIEYLTDHAVDPDMRRYAIEGEAARHYIDVDHYGTYPFEMVPR